MEIIQVLPTENQGRGGRMQQAQTGTGAGKSRWDLQESSQSQFVSDKECKCPLLLQLGTTVELRWHVTKIISLGSNLFSWSGIIQEVIWKHCVLFWAGLE